MRLTGLGQTVSRVTGAAAGIVRWRQGAGTRAALATLLSAYFVFQGHRALQGQWRLDGWIYFALAGALVTYAFTLYERVDSGPPVLNMARVHRPAWRWGGGLITLAGVAAGVWAVKLLWENQAAWREALPLWLGCIDGLLLGSVTFGGIPGGERVGDRGTRRQGDEGTGQRRESVALDPGLSGGLQIGVMPCLPGWIELLLVLAIIGIAVFARTHRLLDMPPGIFVDETNGALDALYLLDGRPDSPFGTGWFETPTGYAYYFSGYFRLLGTTFTALKAPGIIHGVLTVLMLYLLARLLFGVPTALASGYLLAVGRWHFHMSRWGWNEIAPPLAQVAALYFFLRGVQRRSLFSFALGGLLLGLGMYTYLAIRLAVVVILAYIGYRILCERGFLPRNWAGVLIFVVTWALVFAPLAVTYAHNPFTFLNRSRQVSIQHDIKEAGGSLDPLKESVRRHLRMFWVDGDYNPRHNLPGAPMLDPITGGLFLAGLAYAFWRWRDHRRGLLLLWVFITLLGGILSRLSEAPQAYRTVAVMPAVALLAGDALARLYGIWAGLGRRSIWRYTALAGSVVLLGWAGWSNYDTYFHKQAQSPAVWQAFSPVETAVAKEVAAKQADHTLYLAPRLYYFSPLRFLTYRSPAEGGGGVAHPPYRLAQPVDDLPLPDLSGEDALFLLDIHYSDLLELFTRYYPGTKAEMVRGQRGEPLYLSVTVPGGEIVAVHGVTARYTLSDGQTQMERHEAQINVDWASAGFPAGQQPQRVEWGGSLRLPRSGIYQLRGEGGLLVELDGRPYDQPRYLGKGLHRLRVVQADPASGGVARLLWQPPGGAESVVPPEAFFMVPPPDHGLLGHFYRGEGWQGEPVFTRVDPVILFAWPEGEPLPGPFSATWTGSIIAPQTGMYQFTANADDGVRLIIDGQVMGESLRPDTVNQVNARLNLEAGHHRIQIDYFQRGGGQALELWWVRPGGTRQVVPPMVLLPE
ncbi:MAG TPA: hypothetical protein EYH31_06615 [Anaerolineae bacterium]|nr:hypothetical protein [Anaerolineae bacterium]